MSNYIFKNNERGITLIALVITVIIMVILAGVTVNVAINGGLFESAGNAKESTEIVSEKETVQKAVIFAENASKTGIITIAEMQKAINKFEEENTAIAMQNGETIVVKFNESDRYYEIDDKGNVEGPKTLVKDDKAGDITKGGTCTGSAENPFQITCMEDFVAFSIMTNGGNSALGLASNSFANKHVILTESIDFNSIFSYNDYTTTKYGDLNTDGIIEDLRTELTKTDDGCIGFKGILNFAGTFDGQENTIKNIYQKNVTSSKNIALFITNSPCTIKNVILRGTIINTKWHAAGIISSESNIKIINCINYANVTGYNMVGGIVAINRSGGTEIIGCHNYGTITITGYSYQYGGAGGIIGHAESGLTIKDCANEGDVLGSYTRAGIIGHSSGVNIINCYNKGTSVSGIVDWIAAGNTNIINCYNLGECTAGIVDDFAGSNWNNTIELNIKNCYNLGKTSNTAIVKRMGTVALQITLNIENCYNAGESSKAILGTRETSTKTTTITNIINTYYDQSKSTSVGVQIEGITALDEEDMKNNATFVQTLNNNIGTNSDWKRWKLGESGYPVFE